MNRGLRLELAVDLLEQRAVRVRYLRVSGLVQDVLEQAGFNGFPGHERVRDLQVHGASRRRRQRQDQNVL